jgi:hypothetical protein
VSHDLRVLDSVPLIKESHLGWLCSEPSVTELNTVNLCPAMYSTLGVYNADS